MNWTFFVDHRWCVSQIRVLTMKEVQLKSPFYERVTILMILVVLCSVLIKGKDQAVECKCMSALVQLLHDECTAVRANCCGAIMMYVYALF